MSLAEIYVVVTSSFASNSFVKYSCVCPTVLRFICEIEMPISSCKRQ